MVIGNGVMWACNFTVTSMNLLNYKITSINFAILFLLSLKEYCIRKMTSFKRVDNAAPTGHGFMSRIHWEETLSSAFPSFPFPGSCRAFSISIRFAGWMGIYLKFEIHKLPVRHSWACVSFPPRLIWQENLDSIYLSVHLSVEIPYLFTTLLVFDVKFAASKCISSWNTWGLCYIDLCSSWQTKIFPGNIVIVLLLQNFGW